MTIKTSHLKQYVPSALGTLVNPQTDIPKIAKDKRKMAMIEESLHRVPTKHILINHDARDITFLEDKSVHLVLTSPPYWTLKKYKDNMDQLGAITDYESFLRELDKVWEQCYRLLVPGGRLVCVVGDVCLSRRKNSGRHTIVPLHSSIQEHCRILGYDNLAPIIWAKIANAAFEASGNGGGFLGKPYEPNAIVKNDIEYVLMQRKPGGYRKPSIEARILSIIWSKMHKIWFQPIWADIPGASTRDHPAPFPEDLAERIIRMFSFAGDTVLDPFLGTGTTCIAAAKCGRNSIGVEVERAYFDHAKQRIQKISSSLFSNASVSIADGGENGP